MLVALAYAVVAAVWSGAWIVSKSVVGYVPPLELSAVRFLVAGGILLIVSRLFHVPLGTKRLGVVVLASALGILGYHAFVFVGLTMATASDAGLIVPTLSPVFTAILATTVGERLSRMKVGGLALATAGAALVVLGAQTASAAPDDRRVLGVMLILAGTLCQAGYVVVGSIAMRDRSPLALVTLSALFGAAMLFPLGFFEHGYTDLHSWGLSGWASVAYLSVFATIVGFIAFYWLVRRLGPGLGSTVTYLVPVATLGLAFVVLAERPQPLQLIGGAVILAGVQLTNRRSPTPKIVEVSP